MYGEKRKPGRPKKDPEEVRNERVTFRATKEEHERLIFNAKLRGLSIADYIVSLMDAAEREDNYDSW